MKELTPVGKHVYGHLLAAASLLLAACGGSTALIRDCCYQGDAVLIHLDGVQFVAPDGSISSFDEIYPDFTPQDSFATKSFPVQKGRLRADHLRRSGGYPAPVRRQQEQSCWKNRRSPSSIFAKAPWAWATRWTTWPWTENAWMPS